MQLTHHQCLNASMATRKSNSALAIRLNQMVPLHQTMQVIFTVNINNIVLIVLIAFQ